MTMSVRDGGTWKTVTSPRVRDGGTWKTVLTGWVKDAGTWKVFYTGSTVTMIGGSWTYVAGSPAEYHLQNDGRVRTRSSSSLIDRGEWCTPPADVGLYQCRATVTSGALTSGTTGTWLSCASTNSWTRGTAAGTANFCTFTLEIRRAVDGFVVGSTSVTIGADRT
jgi:hypothetical protein